MKKNKNGCWIWQLGKTNLYYPFAYYDGTVAKAATASYEEFVGLVPKGKLLRHTCDNVKCISPEHLIPGTDAENIQDFRVRNSSRAKKIDKQFGIRTKQFWKSLSSDERSARTKKASLLGTEARKNYWAGLSKKAKMAGADKINNRIAAMTPRQRKKFLAWRGRRVSEGRRKATMEKTK